MSRRRRRSSAEVRASAASEARPSDHSTGTATAAWPITLVAALALVVATVVTFRPVVEHHFLNWDDPDVVAANPRLHQPIPDVVAWAFTTREMGHYQPLSWLAFAAVAGDPPSAAAVHGAAVALHALIAMLLFGVITLLLDDAGRTDGRVGPALAAAALFALHPLRVEPVAWASALPYLLSYAPLLGAVATWLLWSRGGAAGWLTASLMLFTVSQFARVTAPLFAAVLMAVAWARPHPRQRPGPAILRSAAAFAVIGLALAALEAGARGTEAVADFGLRPRVGWALTHPVLYLWQMAVPVTLTPLNPLPRTPVTDWPRAIVAVAGAAVLLTIIWRLWGRRPALALCGSYLALLLPVLGLFPSGLQLTADRYTYGPAMVVAVGIALALSALSRTVRRAGVAAALVASVVLAASAHAYTAHWRDSTSVWTRALAVDADNDVARYNLALALIETGLADDAVRELETLVAQVPDHEVGRRRLGALLADRAQGQADEAASAGRLTDAVAAYDQVLAQDPGRARARLNRGMALVQLGQARRAVADLEAGGAATSGDPAVAAALAFAWSETGRAADAIRLLRGLHDREPANLTVAMNLARLLLTATPTNVRDPEAALALAARVNDATGGRDPRVLGTLAEALAATGRPRDAAEAWTVAIAVATESGDTALATDLRRRESRAVR